MSEPPKSRSSRRPPEPGHARDQDASPFAPILQELIPRLPGAYAAALVDGEGETVDYCGAAEPFDVKVSAAHWRIVLQDIAALTQIGAPQSIVVRGTRRSFIIYALPEAYALVVLLRRRAGFSASSRAFFACERALCREAAWIPSARISHWFPVDVICDARRRPAALGAMTAPLESQSVVVLGAVVGLPARERGYRVRMAAGIEVTLVREPGGCWYADELVAS